MNKNLQVLWRQRGCNFNLEIKGNFEEEEMEGKL